MKLSEEINRLIEQIPPRDMVEESVIHQRWMRLSGKDTPEPDYLPIVVKGLDRDRPDEWKNIWPGHIRFTLEERINDPEKMLYDQLVQLVPLQRLPGDGTGVVMPMFGNSFLLSGLGLRTRIMGDCLEPSRSLSREEVRNLELVEDMGKTELISKAIRFIQYVRSVLPEHIPVGLCFMMSPYDLAYLIRGHELMADMYEAPDIVHRLMGLCTDLFIRSTKLLKKEAGEPDDFYRYFNHTFAGGGLLCEDCCIMLSPELHREFSIPYTRQALDALGGGWIHFCGDGRHIINNYLEIPNLYGLLYGQLDQNGTVEETVGKLVTSGKALNCSMGKRKDESWADYFRRVLEIIDHRKYLFTEAWTFTDEKRIGKSILEIWHEAQDRAFVK